MISGRGSAIDEYIVHKDLPLYITNIIDFKYLSKYQHCHLTPQQQKALFLLENTELSRRFLLIIHVENKKTLEAINRNVNQKGVKIILMKKFLQKCIYLNKMLLIEI
jgi:hypothetical protein